VISNSGLIGGLLYFGFVWQSMTRRLPQGPERANSQAILNGVRYAYIPTFIVSLLIGTTPDFNNYNAFLYATALAVALGARKQPTPSWPLAPGPWRRVPDGAHGAELPRW
jgi:hypothetical protein